MRLQSEGWFLLFFPESFENNFREDFFRFSGKKPLNTSVLKSFRKFTVYEVITVKLVG